MFTLNMLFWNSQLPPLQPFVCCTRYRGRRWGNKHLNHRGRHLQRCVSVMRDKTPSFPCSLCCGAVCFVTNTPHCDRCARAKRAQHVTTHRPAHARGDDAAFEDFCGYSTAGPLSRVFVHYSANTSLPIADSGSSSSGVSPFSQSSSSLTPPGSNASQNAVNASGHGDTTTVRMV
jgi:hypothetical protein